MERPPRNLPAYTSLPPGQLQRTSHRVPSEVSENGRTRSSLKYGSTEPCDSPRRTRGDLRTSFNIPEEPPSASPTNSEDEPLLHDFVSSGHHLARTDEKVSSTKGLIHLVKGNLGTGILAIPDAVRHAGLFGGLIYLPLLAAVCMHCMHLLVESVSELKVRCNRDNFDYAKAGDHAFRSGPLNSRKAGHVFGIVINVFLTLTQIGFCVVYVIFLAANLQNLLDDLYPKFGMGYDFYIGIAGAAICLVSMLSTLKSLVMPSFISNFCILGGLLCLLIGYLFSDLPSVDDRRWFAPAKELPMFLATAVYAFEGIGTVLPIHKSMIQPKEFTAKTGVLNTAMSIVTIGYMSIGFYGFLKYGDLVKGSITLNIPQTEPLAIVISVLFMIAIYLTYPLMLYVPVEILTPTVCAWFPNRPTWHPALAWMLRYTLVLVTIGMALLIPRIDLAISFVGAFASSTLALIFPPFIHMLVFWDTLGWLSKTKNFLIMAFGTCSMVLGTISSIAAMQAAF